MPCESCAAQFTLVRRKRCCADCGRYFCSTCVSRDSAQGSVCESCRILATRPLARIQLDRLRVRDLQCYLHRQRVSTAGCVEKEDLVNLVISHVDSGNFIRRPPPSQPGEFAQAINTIKGFTANLFSSFDIGSHNGDRAHKNRQNGNRSSNIFNSGSSSSSASAVRPNAGESRPTSPDANTNSAYRNVDRSRIPGNATAPITVEISAPSPQPPPPPKCIITDASPDNESQASEINLQDTNDCIEIEDDPDDPDWEIVTPPLPQDSDILLLESDTPLRRNIRATSDLDLPSRTTDDSSNETSSLKDAPLATPLSSSRINLSDLKDMSQIEGLNVKQLKELLILNRVDFKGCCERKELLERAERLWRENTKSREDLETSGHSEFCKICMDAPMECIILECGHIATCIQCGKRLSECPICRQYVIRVVRFFRS